MSPLTTRYKFGSKYLGKSSTSSELVAGRSSDILTQTVFPAAMAPAWKAIQPNSGTRKQDRMAHERAREKHYRVIEWHEDKYNSFWFLANVGSGAKIDGESSALWLGPFLKIVKGVLDLLEGDVVLEAKLR